MLKKNKFIKNPLLICLYAYMFICFFIALQPNQVEAKNISLTNQFAADASVNLPAAPTPLPSVTSGQEAAKSVTLSDFLRTFYIYLSRFTLLASFLMIVLAIYVYMTSNGDTKKIGKAKEYLTSAIIGMVAVAFAYTFFEILNPDILKLGS